MLPQPKRWRAGSVRQQLHHLFGAAGREKVRNQRDGVQAGQTAVASSLWCCGAGKGFTFMIFASLNPIDWFLLACERGVIGGITTDGSPQLRHGLCIAPVWTRWTHLRPTARAGVVIGAINIDGSLQLRHGLCIGQSVLCSPGPSRPGPAPRACRPSERSSQWRT